MNAMGKLKVVCILPAMFFLCLGDYAFAGDPQARSEVRIIGAIPRLFVNGKQVDSYAVNVYYLPETGKSSEGRNKVPRYSSEKWFVNMKALIDQAVSNNARIILLNVWWAELDKSNGRPKQIADTLDFNNLDRIFDYAYSKKAYIIPYLVFFPFVPEWWLQENNFPPFNKEKKCDFCETDSYGNMYINASMNTPKVQEDWGAFIEALVKRYRNHPALAGWNIGVGATGEDNYGPNYINLMGYGNATERIERKPLMFTDYSPFFEQEFRRWMRERYKDNKTLQTAWQDTSVTLVGLKIPKPQELIQEQRMKMPFFPDPTDIFASAQGDDVLSSLTGKGVDFYEFRNDMRRQDRRYYSSLFKKNDPSHILVFSAASDDVLAEKSLCDGISFSLAGTSDRKEENLFYYLALDIVKRAVKHKKLVFISSEHVCDGARHSKTGECETPEQLRFMEILGKSVRCAGGIFAYTVAPYDSETIRQGSWIPPIWFSPQSMEVAKGIGHYEQKQDCACSFIEEIFVRNKCGSSNSEDNGKLLDKLYGSYCNGKKNPCITNNTTGVTGKCGDGLCDSFEKQVGKCPEDCESLRFSK